MSKITPHKEIIDVLPNCLLIDLNKDAKYNSGLISEYLKNIKVKDRKEIASKAKKFFSKERMAKNYEADFGYMLCKTEGSKMH